MWIKNNILLPILLLSLDTSVTTADDTLRCYVGSFSSYLVFTLDNPTPLLRSPCYDSSKETLIFTFGLNGNATGPYVKAITDTFLFFNYNVILANWEDGANFGNVVIDNIFYPIIARNSLSSGRRFGDALIILLDANDGLTLNRVRLLGFSLGSHFMGEAAKRVQTTGRSIVNLIALDPAGPLFTSPIILGGVDATCADFVFVLHTNPGGLGTSDPKGDVDVFANCENSIQPGCTGILSGTTAITCSHNRAWQYFTEALLRSNSFIAKSARNCDEFRAGRGSRTFVIQLNFDTRARNNYYLVTNPVSPYGRGLAGANPN